MIITTRIDRIGSHFTAVVIGAMQLLLMIVITVAVLELFWLFFTSAADWLRNVDSVPDLQLAVQRRFAGVLLILLGLWWAVHRGQFENVEQEGERILRDG